MSILEKAKLREIKADANETATDNAVDVQFNPTSLKLKIANSIEGGQARGRQRRQQNAQSSTVLTVELVFDSADEDNNGMPVSVRSKTEMIEKYVFAKEDGTETPPKLRFEWNEFIVTGIVESVDLDFDLFAPDGTPLRAKTSLSLKEQESKYMMLKRGPGARNSENANKQGGDSGRPGSGASQNSDRSAPSLEGESAPEFAARLGLDAAAWRGLDVDLSAGLSLEAGIEVGFSAGLSASAGIGVSAGLQAGIDLSLEASVGLETTVSVGAGGNVSAGLSSGASAGFALAAAGGVEAAIETVKIAQSQSASDQTVQAFSPADDGGQRTKPKQIGARRPGSPGTAAMPSVGNLPFVQGKPLSRSEQPRTPLVSAGLPSHSRQQASMAQPGPPKADPRSVSYGFGAPLKATVSTALVSQPARVYAGKMPVVRTEGGPTFRKDPTTAPWIELPQRDQSRASADAVQAEKRARPCGFLYRSASHGIKQ